MDNVLSSCWDHKNVGYTGRVKTEGLVVCRLQQWYSVFFICVRCISVCALQPDVCVAVCDLSDRVSECVWCCYSSSKGRCKKYINTQLKARGYGTPSNTERAAIGQLDLPY